jgi:class 3 adenylate cyclase
LFFGFRIFVLLILIIIFSDHATHALRLMLRMFDILHEYQCPYTDSLTGQPYCISMRVGVASGPVVAGVIGKAKYAYDCM